MAENFRNRDNRKNEDKSWKEYQANIEQNYNADINFSKIGTINDENFTDMNESCYEYGNILEENLSAQLESQPSSLNINSIRHNEGTRGSRTNILDSVALGSKSKSNRNLADSHKEKQPNYYTERKNYSYKPLAESGFNTKKSAAASSTNDKSVKQKPSVRQTKPNSNNSSLIKSNKNLIYVDRSTWAQKAKPNNQRPLVEVQDDDSEIYDGEDNSFRESEFNQDQSEEFIEEIYQSINTSLPPDGPIAEVLSEEESSNEMQKRKPAFQNQKQKNLSTFDKNERDLKDYQSKNYTTKETVPSTQENIYANLAKELKNVNRRNDYNNFIKGSKFNLSNKDRFRSEKYATNDMASTYDNKETAISPELNYATHDPRDTHSKHLYNSNDRMWQLGGDSDALSKFSSGKKNQREEMRSGCTASFEKHIEQYLKHARDYKYWYNNSGSQTQPKKTMKKAWRSTKEHNSHRVDINDHTVDEIVHSIDWVNDTPEDFLESFCHKYTNINSSVPASFTERMLLDIEKREKKQQELEKAEKAYQLLHQRPLDKEEKEMCHRRLYTDAFYRAYKLTDLIRVKEAQEMPQDKRDLHTASKKRINEFVEKVNNEILENQKILDQKRKIKELKEEIEYQKIKNRSISRGKLSRERENALTEKMTEYERRKWVNREHKIRKQQQKIEEEMKSYFKPQVSTSSKRLAIKKRNKKQGIVTGGKSMTKQSFDNRKNNHTIDTSMHDSIFDRLYNDSKERQIEKWRKSQNHSECNVYGINTSFKNKDSRATSRSKLKTRTNPSFQMNYKASPLASTDQLYPPSPRINEENTRSIMNKYLIDSSKVQNNIQNLRSSSNKKHRSNGVSSPCEFISWNEGKYNSRSIDHHQELHQLRSKDEERQLKLMQPLNRQYGVKSMNSYTSETMNSGDDTQELVHYTQMHRPRNKSKNKASKSVVKNN